jgi:AraC-like DNA-binding protein
MIILLMVALQLILLALMVLWYYIRTKPEKPAKAITINYNPVKLEQKPDSEKDFLDFINNNFDNPDLSLSLISSKTGFSRRKIAGSIALQFDCNVKTYINRIRVNEARRLLTERKLKFSEIAYKVGFSSPSNFNRLFKNLTGKSPSEFLQNPE